MAYVIPMFSGPKHGYWPESRPCRQLKSSRSASLSADDFMKLLLAASQSARFSKQTTKRQPVPAVWRNKIDCQGFSPDEITVKVNGAVVNLHARHVDGERENTAIYEIHRKIELPDDVDSEKLTTHLSDEGTLYMTAPKRQATRTEVTNAKAVKEGHSPSKETSTADTKKPAKTSAAVVKADSDTPQSKLRGDWKLVSVEDGKEYQLEVLVDNAASDVTVTCTNSILYVTMKYETVSSSGYYYCQSRKTYDLPADADTSKIRSYVSTPGLLTVAATQMKETVENKQETVENKEENEEITVNEEVTEVNKANTVEKEETKEADELPDNLSTNVEM